MKEKRRSVKQRIRDTKRLLSKVKLGKLTHVRKLKVCLDCSASFVTMHFKFCRG